MNEHCSETTKNGVMTLSTMVAEYNYIIYMLYTENNIKFNFMFLNV